MLGPSSSSAHWRDWLRAGMCTGSPVRVASLLLRRMLPKLGDDRGDGPWGEGPRLPPPLGDSLAASWTGICIGVECDGSSSSARAGLSMGLSSLLRFRAAWGNTGFRV